MCFLKDLQELWTFLFKVLSITLHCSYTTFFFLNTD